MANNNTQQEIPTTFRAARVATPDSIAAPSKSFRTTANYFGPAGCGHEGVSVAHIASSGSLGSAAVGVLVAHARFAGAGTAIFPTCRQNTLYCCWNMEYRRSGKIVSDTIKYTYKRQLTGQMHTFVKKQQT